MYIIGIAGGTGSGKTTVVRKIIESLPLDKVALIPQDSYYNDTTGMTMEERRLSLTVSKRQEMGFSKS